MHLLAVGGVHTAENEPPRISLFHFIISILSLVDLEPLVPRRVPELPEVARAPHLVQVVEHVLRWLDPVNAAPEPEEAPDEGELRPGHEHLRCDRLSSSP